MPIIKSAIKRVRQTAKRRDRNVSLKRDIKSAVKAFQEKPSAKTLSAAQSELDTAVKKNLLHKRTAARRKAQLSRDAKAAGVKLATGKTTAKKPAAATKTAAKPAAKSTAAKTATKPAAKKAPAKKTTAAAKKPAAKKATK